jgi:transcriptional regulator with XRE-family HTH domain
MANRQPLRTEGQLRGTRLLHDLGAELREARLASGATQHAVASMTGMSRRRISEIERGRLAKVQLRHLAAFASAVGLRLHTRMYPAGPALRDRAQLALLDRFRRRLPEVADVRLEVPIGADPRDMRAWDMVIVLRGRQPTVTVGVEAMTRLRDMQSQLRAAQLKRQDSGVSRLVLLLADTHANRSALASAEPLIRAAFPVRTRAAMAALTAGRDTGGDALIVM